MEIKLSELVGMNESILKSLSKYRIFRLDDFAEATNTNDKREALAKKIKQPLIFINYFSKQADLLQCNGMSPFDADRLISAGIRCLDDLIISSPDKIEAFFQNEFNTTKFSSGKDISEEVLRWIEEFLNIDTTPKTTTSAKVNTRSKSIIYQNPLIEYEVDSNELMNPNLLNSGISSQMKNSNRSFSNSHGNDLADIISGLGRGIAEAQRQLDLSSIDIQNEILEDPELASYGLNATWYTIPEINFSLKMEYVFSEDATSEINGENSEKDNEENANKINTYKDKRNLKMKVVPMNASHTNTYKTQKSQESVLNLKFVPVPPPENAVRRTFMPNLIGLSKEEAIKELEDIQYTGNFKESLGEVKNQKESEVTKQDPEPGSLLIPKKQSIIIHVVNQDPTLIKKTLSKPKTLIKKKPLTKEKKEVIQKLVNVLARI